MANDPIKLVDVGALDRFKTDIENEIPDSIQYSTMPTASAELNGTIVQFTGTTGTYHNGYFYKCQAGSTAGTYEWVAVSVQAGGGGSSVQSDWNQTNPSEDDYIKNKPDLTEHLPIIPTIKTATERNVNFDDNVGTAIDVTWNGLTSFSGTRIWTDRTDIYYSNGSDQYVLDKSTSIWTTKTWNGLTSLNGIYVWTDGTDIYYSNGSDQYVLDKSTSTWTTKTWNGLTSFYGDYVWTDGTDIYYSLVSGQYVLDKSTSTWTTKTWNGLTSFSGYRVWTDGMDIYYSDSSDQYVLDKSTSTWTTKTWNGLTSFSGNYVWTDGTDIYYSYNSLQYVLDKSTSTWTAKSWNGLTRFNGTYVWTDGTDIYYSDTGINKKLINRRHINDYTTAEKTKLGGIATGATANLVSDSTVTLYPGGWSGASAPYTNTKVYTGLLSTDKPIIDLVVSSTVQTGLDEIEQFSYISRVESANDSLIFYCYEDKPDISLTIAVKVVR